MLRLLYIENIAVIEQAEILFGEGFHVLTGETGAGKSIVIDAISAILGERAYRDMIRTGANKALVRAVFDRVPQLSWFEENGVPYEEELTLHREIFSDGRNVCRVNSVPVSVSVLKKLGIGLINIHGQHDSAALFDENYHLSFLDSFACMERELEDYSVKYQKLQQLRQELRRLNMDEGEKLRRMETLKYQIDEISRAGLKAGEDETLENRAKLLRNAEKISDGLHMAADSINGGEDTDGAGALLAQAEKAVAKLSRYDSSMEQLHSLLTDLMYQVQDVGEQLSDKLYELSYSASELEQIEERLDLIHRLRRKYGADCAAILDYLAQAKNELDEIEFADDRLAQLKVEEKALEQAARTAALVLRQKRQQAATGLTQRILQELSDLDMKKVRFSCEFSPTELSPLGADSVAFYMSANAGEALKPLSKVASGGELARIMLALKNVLAEKDQVATLIFDEVDTGVSGRAAQKVAEKLKAVSRNKQVLCVTHLPQLAALADTHLRISKEERSGRTYTTVEPLDFEGRKLELARIMGGAQITETTLQSAAEMLS